MAGNSAGARIGALKRWQNPAYRALHETIGATVWTPEMDDRLRGVKRTVEHPWKCIAYELGVSLTVLHRRRKKLGLAFDESKRPKR